MDLVKSFSRRSFFILMVFMLLLMVLLCVGFYFGANRLTADLSTISNSVGELPDVKSAADRMITYLEAYKNYALPAAAGIFVILIVFPWLFLRRSLSKAINKFGVTGPRKAKKPAAKPTDQSFESKPGNKDHDRRLYLHLLAVLQREGRLMDFFAEDLAPYEDAQIGAAVRTIHENCRKVIDKYLAPTAVVGKTEGEQMEIPEDFDSSAVKLTGNVTGKPPFNGILRHRGWRVKRVELPELSSSLDSSIIAPAEVEIE